MKRGRPEPVAGTSWPSWARGLVSALLGFHLTAILAAALAADPASPLERSIAGFFAWYYQVIDQGYSYRYYAPEPPPTPVIEARLRFADGRPERIVRLPDRDTRPRMRYQRELALANHLFEEFAASRNLPPEIPRPVSHWAPSFARHLGHVHGCQEVAFFVKMHLIPPLADVQRRLAQPHAQPIDLDAEEFYSDLEQIGVYQCDAS